VRTMVIHMRRILVSSARPGKARKVRPVTPHELHGYQITKNLEFDIRLQSPQSVRVHTL
jgi:nitrate reductase cytochrome c-type subunit